MAILTTIQHVALYSNNYALKDLPSLIAFDPESGETRIPCAKKMPSNELKTSDVSLAISWSNLSRRKGGDGERPGSSKAPMLKQEI